MMIILHLTVSPHEQRHHNRVVIAKDDGIAKDGGLGLPCIELPVQPEAVVFIVANVVCCKPLIGQGCRISAVLQFDEALQDGNISILALIALLTLIALVAFEIGLLGDNLINNIVNVGDRTGWALITLVALLTLLTRIAFEIGLFGDDLVNNIVDVGDGTGWALIALVALLALISFVAFEIGLLGDYLINYIVYVGDRTGWALITLVALLALVARISLVAFQVCR